MTGLEWVTALVRLHGMSSDAAADAAARRALETVDLMDAADRKIGAYSKGMRQRVKLAQAIVHDPELLILDEPLSGMDPIMRRRTIRLIKDWGRAGQERRRLEPHPARDRGDDVEHPADQQRPDPRRRRTSTRFASSSTSIRTRVSIRAADPRALARRLLAGRRRDAASGSSPARSSSRRRDPMRSTRA